MFKKILIANRGAIACRIARTLKSMGIASVAVYSDADRHSQHVADADEAIRIGPAAAAQSYLRVEAILEAARQTKAESVLAVQIVVKRGVAQRRRADARNAKGRC